MTTIKRDWESVFSRWAQAPSASEQERCDNAVKMIKTAIAGSEKLKNRGVKIFTQGSYRNRVNVRKDSDVDVGVMMHDVFLSQYPEGKSREDYGVEAGGYPYSQFKNELEEALVDYFGRAAVTRGKKAFDIKASSYHVEADVVPLYEFRRYWDSANFRAGVALIPDNGDRIENYPERLLEYWPNTPLHYENGVSKNNATGRAFKGMVRILKCLRNEMDDAGFAEAKIIPSYLLECLAWNTPNDHYGSLTWDGKFQSIMRFLASNLGDSDKWTEVDNIKYLFHGSQPWTRSQANEFVKSAWGYVGCRQ